jgi:hypothetical protein
VPIAGGQAVGWGVNQLVRQSLQKEQLDKSFEFHITSSHGYSIISFFKLIDITKSLIMQSLVK